MIYINLVGSQFLYTFQLDFYALCNLLPILLFLYKENIFQGRDLEGIPEHAAVNDEENGKHDNGSGDKKDDSDSSSSSSKESTPKESMFKVKVLDN